MTEPQDELEVDEVLDENEASVAYDIAAYPSDLTLSVIAQMWKDGDIAVPEFQRNFVWTIRQASLLVESFLLGLPVPQVFLHIDDEGKSQVIDGQQRIMSVVFFMEGYFGLESLQGKRQVFRLKGLAGENPYSGKKFSELTDVDQRRFKGAVLRAINIRQLNPKGSPTSIYHIFERLNTGGTPLKPQEIRNCVYRGELAKQLKELNGNEAWRKIVGKKTFDKHQKDVELLLRIFAMTYWAKSYKKPLKEFLNIVMATEQEAKSKQAKAFFKLFPEVADTVLASLGAKPFHIRGPLNSSAMESVFSVLMSNSDRIPSKLASRYVKLKNDETFQQTTFYSTSDESVVHDRLKVTSKILID